MFAIKSHRPPALYRLRYQLGGCLLLAALIPYALRGLTLGEELYLEPLNTTLLGSVLAIALGTWLFRSLTTFPGTEAGTHIVSSFSVAYGGLAIVFLVTRLSYNIPAFVAGYVISILWFFYVATSLRKRHSLRIGIMGIGERYELPTSRDVLWVPIHSVLDSIEGLDAVATDLRHNLPDEWERRLADFALQGIPVYHFKHLLESLTGRVELEHLSENSFGSLTPLSAWMTLKHVIDWLVAAVALVVLSPVLLAVAIGIRLSSPGPALFKQTRIGYQGRPFTVYKFRTMRVASGEAGDGRALAMTQTADERIFPFGRFLRTTRLDELPQMLNVLRNEMSWIGPRPEAAILSEWYERELSFYKYRHIVRPGITGWAQVCQGHVAELDEVQSKLNYDFYYIKKYSIWIDILIIVRTVKTIVTGFGSK